MAGSEARRMTKLTTMACIGLLSVPLLAKDTSDLNDAKVTLPYNELKTLWESAHTQKSDRPKPPVTAALLAARYDLKLEPGQAEGAVELDVRSLSDEWTAVKLIESNVQVDAIDPADAQVVETDDHYSLLTNSAGSTKVVMRFAIPVSDEGGNLVIRLPYVEAPIKTLSLTGLPEGKTVNVNGGTLVTAAKGMTTYRLPAGRAVTIGIAAPPEPPAPSHWRSESQAIVTYTGGRLRYQAHVGAFASDGSGLEMDLAIPASARVLEVKGEDLVTWSMGKTLHLRWKTRDVLTREAEVVYEISQPATPGTWKLVAPVAIGNEGGDATFAVAGEQGMEIQPVKPVRAVLGRWLAQHSSQAKLVTVGGDGAVNVKWLPLVATSSAVVESAQSKMRVVLDGALLNECTYLLRHDGPFTWQVQLPANSDLLNCVVNGQRVDPVDRGNSVIELAMDGQQRTEVKFSYTAKKPAFQPITGQLQIELPKTALLIHKLDWEVQIPAGYELAAIEGNIETTPNGKAAQIAMHKELCKDEQPMARLFYQKAETANR
jgi:hypothetical protein